MSGSAASTSCPTLWCIEGWDFFDTGVRGIPPAGSGHQEAPVRVITHVLADRDSFAPANPIRAKISRWPTRFT